MAFPTSVNDQITDAVTQANVNVLGEAPAIAMGTLYQTLAHTAGILFANAVAAQQQQNTLAMAAINQGIMQIYSVHTAADAAVSAQPSASADALQSQALQSQALQASVALTSAATFADDVNPQIEAAVKLANESALENAGRFAYALRASADAMSAALDGTSKALQGSLMRTLQAAATAACLEGMLRHPEKVEDYQNVLQRIKQLV